MTYKECQVFLRTATKSAAKGPPLTSTFLYTLLAHLHKRVHMKTFAGLRGGWRLHGRATPLPSEKDAPFPESRSRKKWDKCYGGCADFFYRAACIRDLDDQAVWIQKMQIRKELSQFADVANFVLCANASGAIQVAVYSQCHAGTG